MKLVGGLSSHGWTYPWHPARKTSESKQLRDEVQYSVDNVRSINYLFWLKQIADRFFHFPIFAHLVVYGILITFRYSLTCYPTKKQT